MTPERYERLNRLVDAALDLDPLRRAAFLDEVCAGDAELRAEAEALIAADETGGDFLSESAVSVIARDAASHLEKQASRAGGTIGRYQVLRRLGEGGHGEVWLARDTQLDREVALKLLNAGASGSEDQVARLHQEARAASSLNHPNIVTIYEIGDAAGLHFIAQEFVPGETLRALLAGRRIKPEEAMGIADQVAAALGAAAAAAT